MKSLIRYDKTQSIKHYSIAESRLMESISEVQIGFVYLTYQNNKLKKLEELVKYIKRYIIIIMSII